MRRFTIGMFFIIMLTVPHSLSDMNNKEAPISTFSIVAFDPNNGDLGVAVASKFFAVGSVVPWAKAGVGAIATQSYANTSYGPKGLKMLEAGFSSEETLKKLTQLDEGRDMRQIGIVDARGNAATYTGEKCLNWAGGIKGKNFTCQGNILTGKEVIEKMAETFKATKGNLADRLFAALEAGDKTGGDSRGRQSAALIVVRKGGGYGGYNDRYIDIRVDDSPDPIAELKRLLKIQHTISYLNAATSYYNQKNYEMAAKEAEKAVKNQPNSADALYDLAIYYTLQGKVDKALKALEESLSINPALKGMAIGDGDLKGLRENKKFKEITGKKN